MRPNSKKSILAVHIEPSAISACWASRDGEVRRSRVCVSDAEWNEGWNLDLRIYDEALNQIRSRLGVPRGANVVVAFESPTSVAEAQSIPQGDIQSGLASLRLSMCERLSLPRQGESVCTKTISSATKGKDPHPGVAIVSAACESNVDSIRMWIERLGFRCVGVIPAGALLLNEVAQASKASGDSGLSVILHIDNHRSALCVVMKGQIELLRTFEVGLNNLGRTLIHAASGNPDNCLNSDTLSRALECLHLHGIPQRDTVYDDERGLSANAILPLIQPVIQRLCVEIKQSLRMVLRRAGGAQVQLQIRGPGSSVPRLPDTIAQFIDAEIVGGEDQHSDISVDDCLRSGGGWKELVLSSRRVSRTVNDQRFRRAMVIGGALGLVTLGLEAGHYVQISSELDTMIQKMDGQIQQVRKFDALSQVAVDMDERLGQGQALLDEFLGAQPDWNAVLTGLAMSAESRVELTEIRGIGDMNDATIQLYGIADAREGSTALADFIEKLQACRLCEAVEVESRLLIEIEDKPVYQFRLRISLKEFGPELMTMEYTP
jgi:Tfp pilus assembly PilM family ATPase/Tfp pilus assembly protein PilN